MNRPLREQALAPALKAMRTERDRFVALAFCWGDILLELNSALEIVFSGGVVEKVTGRKPDSLRGEIIDTIIAPEQQGLMRQLLKIAESAGRIEQVSIKLQGADGPTAPMPLTGYRFAELDGHYFLALQVGIKSANAGWAGGGDQLHDTEGFAEFAREVLSDPEKAKDSKVTLLAMPQLGDLKERLDPGAQQNLMTTLGAALRASSVDSEGAANLEDGRYGLVHRADLDILALQNQLSDITRALDPIGQGTAIESATLTPDDKVSGEDLARGLIYAINRFQKSNRTGVTLASLSTNLASLAEEAVQSVEAFRKVVSNADFHIAFQPIINLADGSVHHYEALARFRGRYGESPDRYIAFAEETGLISHFDITMAEKAVEWLEGHKDTRTRIAVNISGQSATQITYITQLHELLRRHPWTAGRLIFEITESSRVEDLEAANKFIQSLRTRGYPVCLDDFGAGAAGFQYLSAMEVDIVKLDGTSVRSAFGAPKGEAFLRALCTLCRDLDVQTIAEMIDNPKMLAFSRDCGVDFAQGYLLGRPDKELLKDDRIDLGRIMSLGQKTAAAV